MLSGELMHCNDEFEPDMEYVWWYGTYPLEFAEFLLTSALARGVWLHPLSANDVGYMSNGAISHDGELVRKISGTVANDTKSSTVSQYSSNEMVW